MCSEAGVVQGGSSTERYPVLGLVKVKLSAALIQRLLIRKGAHACRCATLSRGVIMDFER